LTNFFASRFPAKWACPSRIVLLTALRAPIQRRSASQPLSTRARSRLPRSGVPVGTARR
jgi:hypothetical protein